MSLACWKDKTKPCGLIAGHDGPCVTPDLSAETVAYDKGVMAGYLAAKRDYSPGGMYAIPAPLDCDMDCGDNTVAKPHPTFDQATPAPLDLKKVINTFVTLKLDYDLPDSSASFGFIAEKFIEVYNGS
jgi:hypothetical protein